ncbi:MAG TPA: hypothetical protein VJ201_02055 [Candidatus Babeliales bacterium]|nr:hypothetical protein [Candidatus Babeliales bacterium]
MRIITKPWGKEEVIEINDRYMMKKLTMWKGHRCSLQYHNTKRETIYVIAGNLKITLGTTEQGLQNKIYGPNETVTVEPKMIHRMEAIEDSIYLEASTPEIDDVIRLHDDYKR